MIYLLPITRPTDTQVPVGPLYCRIRAWVVKMNSPTNIHQESSVSAVDRSSLSQQFPTLLFHTLHSQQDSPVHIRFRSRESMVLLWLARHRTRIKLVGCCESLKVSVWPQHGKLTDRQHPPSPPRLLIFLREGFSVVLPILECTL